MSECPICKGWKLSCGNTCNKKSCIDAYNKQIEEKTRRLNNYEGN